MKNEQHNKTYGAAHVKKTGSQWKLAILSLPLIIAAVMLMSVFFIKDKVSIDYSESNTYRAGDVALFVAMPVLNAIVK